MRQTGGTRGRAPRSSAQWRMLVERFERCGQPRGKLCAANGLTLSPFDQWRRKLGEAQTATDDAHREAVFVERTDPAPAPGSATARGTGAWEVELELGAGVVLRVRRAVPCRAPCRRVASGCAPSPPTCGVHSMDCRPGYGGRWARSRRAVSGSCSSIAVARC